MFLTARGKFLSLGFATLLTASSLLAQTIPAAKVAIINAQKSVADTQEIKKAQQSLSAKYQPRQQEVETLQRELQTIQTQLRTPNITPDRQASLTADGTRKQRELQRLTEDLNADVEHERQDILGHAGRQMADVVKRVAEQRGIDVVIDISNTIYFRPALDITTESTVAYDKAYPAK